MSGGRAQARSAARLGSWPRRPSLWIIPFFALSAFVPYVLFCYRRGLWDHLRPERDSAQQNSSWLVPLFTREQSLRMDQEIYAGVTVMSLLGIYAFLACIVSIPLLYCHLEAAEKPPLWSWFGYRPVLGLFCSASW